MTRTEQREIRAVARRLLDNPGELACMQVGRGGGGHLRIIVG